MASEKALKKAKKTGSKISGTPEGWSAQTDGYEVGLDYGTAHSGTRSAYIRSTEKEPKEFGYLMQAFSAEKFAGKRLRMSAWIKTKNVKERCQLWLRTEILGRDTNSWIGPYFDNMHDRPVKGTTDWTKYDLVVDVPQEGYSINFGMMLISTGEAWLDSISFESVSQKVKLTSRSVSQPRNLDFETDDLAP